MAKKSEFRKLMEKVFEQNGISLKEWDDPNELKYMEKHPGDHTGEGSITYEEFEIPTDANHTALMNKLQELADDEELYTYTNYKEWLAAQKAGTPIELEYDRSKMIVDLDIQYEISGYPYEEISINKVLFNDVDITDLLTPDDMRKIQDYVDMHIDTTDNSEQDIRDTYYGSIL